MRASTTLRPAVDCLQTRNLLSGTAQLAEPFTLYIDGALPGGWRTSYALNPRTPHTVRLGSQGAWPFDTFDSLGNRVAGRSDAFKVQLNASNLNMPSFSRGGSVWGNLNLTLSSKVLGLALVSDNVSLPVARRKWCQIRMALVFFTMD
jgi:hypothetical protein